MRTAEKSETPVDAIPDVCEHSMIKRGGFTSLPRLRWKMKARDRRRSPDRRTSGHCLPSTKKGIVVDWNSGNLNIQQRSLKVCGCLSLDDQRLVTVAKGGDSGAFSVLAERHRPAMLRVAHRITATLEDAEDAIQDSFLRAFVHLKSFDGRSSFLTWLTRIVINSSYMILRKRKQRGREISVDSPVEPDDNSSHFQLADDRRNTEKEYIARERLEIVNARIQRLPRIFKNAIALRMSGGSMKEIADIEGISVEAVKSRLLRAKRVLSNKLALQGFSDSTPPVAELLESRHI